MEAAVRMSPLILTTVAVFLAQGVYGQRKNNDPDAYQEEAGQIYSTIFHKYNEKVRPPDYFPDPVLIDVNATLLHIRVLDLMKQEMESILDLQIKWRDKRLAWYPYQVTEISANVSAVWSPDIVYTNGVVPPRAMFTPKVSIMSNGEISWVRRESVITTCRTQPNNNTQVCEISLGFVSTGNQESFGNDTVFSLGDKFGNHAWDIEKVTLFRESEINVAFVLTLQKKYPQKEDTTNERVNCSMSVPYTQNGSDILSSCLSSMCLLCIGLLLAVVRL